MVETISLLGTELAKNSPTIGLLVLFILCAGYAGKVVYEAFENSRKEHSQQIELMFERVDTLQKEVREDANKREEAYRVERDMFMQQLQDFNKALTSLTSVYGEMRADIRDILHNKRD